EADVVRLHDEYSFQSLSETVYILDNLVSRQSTGRMTSEQEGHRTGWSAAGRRGGGGADVGDRATGAIGPLAARLGGVEHPGRVRPADADRAGHRDRDRPDRDGLRTRRTRAAVAGRANAKPRRSP